MPSPSLAETSSAIQAGAAVLQAVLSAGAVYVAARLQDRAQDKRDRAQRNTQLEGVAAAVRWALRTYQNTLKRAPLDDVPLTVLSDAYRREEFAAAIRALRTIAVVQLGDYVLTELVLRLEAHMEMAEREFMKVLSDSALTPSNGIKAHTIIANHQTEIFNAAAGAERRVAELVGRPSAELRPV